MHSRALYSQNNSILINKQGEVKRERREEYTSANRHHYVIHMEDNLTQKFQVDF